MNAFYKTPKTLLASFAIVSFFLSSGTAFAQSTANNTSAVSQCTANVVAPFATTYATSKVSEAIAGGVEIVKGVLPVAVPTNDMGTHITLDAHSTFQDVSKMGLDSIAYGVGQCALTMLTDNTVRWIKGGFQGSPNFAVDTTKLFQDISDGVLQDLSNQIKSIKACDFTPNFIYDLANSVELSAPKRNKFPTRIQCPFPALNITASQFYGPASRFTWGLFETALGDGGNQFAVRVATAEETARRQAEAKATADQKLSWSNGFADIVDTQNCPGMPSDIAELVKKGAGASSDFYKDPTSLTQKEINFYQKQYCLTTTPGKIVESQLSKSLGVEMDRLGFADNMNKILSALIGQLTKEAISGLFKAANNATPATGPSHNPSVMTTVPPTPPAIVISNVASSVTQTAAVLNGYISDTRLPGSVWFEWGTTPSLGNKTAVLNYPANAVPDFSFPLTGLIPNTVYYFRAATQGSQGLVYGSPLYFATMP